MSTPTAVAARSYVTLCQDLFREVGAAGVAPTTIVSAAGEWLRLVNYVRDAELEIQNLWANWKWLRKTLSFYTGLAGDRTGIYTTQGGATSAFPSDLASWDGKLWQLYPANSTQPMDLQVYEWNQVRSEVFDTSDYAQPWRVIIMPDNTLRWDLIPDQSYQGYTEYWSVPYQFVNDTDVSNIPPRFANGLILEWARLKYGMFENAAEQVQRANQFIYGDPGGQAAALENNASGMLARLENDQLPNQFKARMGMNLGMPIVIGGGYNSDHGYDGDWSRNW